MTDFKMVANRQVKDKEQDGGVAMEGTLSVVAADISLIAAEESERQERQEENKAAKDKDLAVQLEIAMEEIGRLKSLMTMLLKKAPIKEAEIQESSRDIANSVARSETEIQTSSSVELQQSSGNTPDCVARTVAEITLQSSNFQESEEN